MERGGESGGVRCCEARGVMHLTTLVCSFFRAGSVQKHGFAAAAATACSASSTVANPNVPMLRCSPRFWPGGLYAARAWNLALLVYLLTPRGRPLLPLDLLGGASRSGPPAAVSSRPRQRPRAGASRRSTALMMVAGASPDGLGFTDGS